MVIVTTRMIDSAVPALYNISCHIISCDFYHNPKTVDATVLTSQMRQVRLLRVK